MKKAQTSQIIVYLLAIVVFAMILIFGYRVIANIRQQTEQANFLSFQKSLESDIKSIYFDYGSVKEVSYSLRGYKEVCFITSYPQMPASVNTPHEIIDNSVNGGVQKNIFLIGNKIDSFYIEKIVVDTGYTNYVCVDIINGKLTIKLTGQGNSALVENV